MSTLGMKRGNGQQSQVDGPEPRASSLGISEPCSLCGRWTGTSLGKACHCAAAEAEFNVATQKARHWGVWGRNGGAVSLLLLLEEERWGAVGLILGATGSQAPTQVTELQLPCFIFHKTSQISPQGQSLAFLPSKYKTRTVLVANPMEVDVATWRSLADEHRSPKQSRCCAEEGEGPACVVFIALCPRASTEGSTEADVAMKPLLGCIKAACLGETGVFSHPEISLGVFSHPEISLGTRAPCCLHLVPVKQT